MLPRSFIFPLAYISVFQVVKKTLKTCRMINELNMQLSVSNQKDIKTVIIGIHYICLQELSYTDISEKKEQIKENDFITHFRNPGGFQYCL